MIYITGDLHGDIERFRAKELKKLKKGDYLIVCGDFGFIWNGSDKEKRILKWIGRRRYNVLFVEGTHDNLDLIESYPKVEWNGGMVHEISGRLRHLCRGNIFDLDGNTILAFGGGESKDSDLRGENWWSSELPSMEELAATKANLASYRNTVDYIVTHQCSRKTKAFLTMDDNNVNVMDAFFDQIRDKCGYKRWFFGSLHINKTVPPREIAIYNAVVPVTVARL